MRLGPFIFVRFPEFPPVFSPIFVATDGSGLFYGNSAPSEMLMHDGEVVYILHLGVLTDQRLEASSGSSGGRATPQHSSPV